MYNNRLSITMRACVDTVMIVENKSPVSHNETNRLSRIERNIHACTKWVLRTLREISAFVAVALKLLLTESIRSFELFEYYRFKHSVTYFQSYRRMLL